MNKIINGKKYDTQTAKEIESISGGADTPNDCNYWRETLYRKKTGEFFLFCTGGANSRYGKWSGNTGYAGTYIKPMSFQQAKNWASENMDADGYELLFGEVEDDGTTEYMTLSFPTSVAAKLRQMSSEQKKSPSNIIADLLANK